MTEKGQLLDAFMWDAKGYFLGVTMWQVDDNGTILKTDGATLKCPWGLNEPDQTVFYKWDGVTWKTEKKPTTPQELEGVIIPHEVSTEHDLELLFILQKLGETPGWTIKRGGNLEWFIEKLPEKTEEEKLEEEMRQELEEQEKKIKDIKDRLVLAILDGDQETIDGLKAEYKTLTGESDE